MLNEVAKEQDFHGQGSQFQLHNALHHHLVVEKHEHRLASDSLKGNIRY